MWVVTVFALITATGCARGNAPAKQPQPEVQTPAPAPGPGTAPTTPAPTTPAPSQGTPAACQPGHAADYFPYNAGTKVSYAGKGNEYASYTVDVIGKAGTKVEWRRNNGGTVMAEVFDVQPTQVTQIYREPEAYDNTPRMNNPSNTNEIVLKDPIAVGTTWTTANGPLKIVDVNASVPVLNNQVLGCVVVVEATGTTVNRWYYHRNYGLILTVFDPTGANVESRLATFAP